MPSDRVIETPDGFDCIVAGRQFGTWRTSARARAAMRVEQKRAAARAASAAMGARLVRGALPIYHGDHPELTEPPREECDDE